MADAKRKRKWDLNDQGEEAPKPPADKVPRKDSETSDAASLAAAKINALLAEKRLTAQPAEETGLIGKRTEQDAEFIRDIDINDLRNRYLLVKGATQTQIQKDAGADVTTRGKYYPDRNLATEQDPPLYLHISASTKAVLEAAVKQIEDIIETGVAPGQEASPETQRPAGGPPRREVVTTKVYVGIDPERMPNVRAKVIGPGGNYVKYIETETSSKVKLRGKGSGYEYGEDEPLHLFITNFRQEDLDRAKKMAEDLIKTVHEDQERFEQERAQRYNRQPSYNRIPASRQDYYGQGAYGAYPSYGQYGYEQSPPPPPPPSTYGQPPPPPPPGASNINPPLPPGPPPPPPPGAPTSPLPPPPASSAPTGASDTSPPASNHSYSNSQSPGGYPGATGTPPTANATAYAPYGQYDAQYAQYAQYGGQYGYDPNQYYYNYNYYGAANPTSAPPTSAPAQDHQAPPGE